MSYPAERLRTKLSLPRLRSNLGPPGEAYAESLGLTYRLHSCTEFHPLAIQNLKFLQYFWAHEV
ncbi:hypothetical protein KSD_93430 [Ktedonobacter sp. SOSP1-85]|uniref:hypothetical protein n=1 Tax=Ktedonobacter sp. SOSP1-85 TaxID=2778367 RepID=UPI0019155DDD|nr:hypothetical protein [Ktedonobacter sp. SOSP1-85]GHO81572.1 hypothetical protein KSD_93430 [Ktedonobacter sp. SOSP1-85]